MTRQITEAVIHHSYSPRDQKLDKSIASFNENHRQRLTLPWKQPLSGVKGSEHVAYHFVIAGNGEYKRTRLDSQVGYHASNIDANNRSIGICLTGNFDVEQPTEAQMKSLREILRMYPGVKITGHRQYKNKSCPGTNFTDKMLADLAIPEVHPNFKKAWDWATENKITNGQRPTDPMTRQEGAQMLYNLTTKL